MCIQVKHVEDSKSIAQTTHEGSFTFDVITIALYLEDFTTKVFFGYA
jgi:hypothetical protein